LPATSVHRLKQNVKSLLKSTLSKKVMTILKTEHFRKIKKKIISLKHKHVTYQIKVFDVTNTTKTLKLN